MAVFDLVTRISAFSAIVARRIGEWEVIIIIIGWSWGLLRWGSTIVFRLRLGSGVTVTVTLAMGLGPCRQRRGV